MILKNIAKMYCLRYTYTHFAIMKVKNVYVNYKLKKSEVLPLAPTFSSRSGKPLSHFRARVVAFFRKLLTSNALPPLFTGFSASRFPNLYPLFTSPINIPRIRISFEGVAYIARSSPVSQFRERRGPI